MLYTCTTDEGSSGSPVLKEVHGQLKIVALHVGDHKERKCNAGVLMKEILTDFNGVQVSNIKHYTCAVHSYALYYMFL